MSQRPIIALPIYEDCSTVHQFFLRNGLGFAAQQSDFSAITLKVFDKETGETIATRSLSAAAVVSNDVRPPSADPRWTTDRRGYNFSNTTLPADLPAGERTVVFEYKFEFADGAVSHVVVEQPTLALLGS